MRTSVFSVAGWVSLGSRWRKSEMRGALAQRGSSRVPSSRGGGSVRAARAILEPSVGAWARVVGNGADHRVKMSTREREVRDGSVRGTIADVEDWPLGCHGGGMPIS